MTVQTFSFLPLLALAAASGLFAFAFRGQRLQSPEALAAALGLTTLATLFYWIKPCPGTGKASRRQCLIGWVCCRLKNKFRCGCTCTTCTQSPPCGTSPCKGGSPAPSFKETLVYPPSASLKLNGPASHASATPTGTPTGTTTFYSAQSVCSLPLQSEEESFVTLSECPPEPPRPLKGGAVLLIRKVPDVEILHLKPNNWCVTTAVAEDDDEKIRAAAEAKILAATGLRPEDIKVYPNITKSVSFETRKTKKQVNVVYQLAEAHPLAEVKADHAWLSLEEALGKTSGCEELAEVLKAFHVTALEKESQWTLDYETMDAKAALAQGKVGQWYRDSGSEKKDALYRVLERKKKTIQFQLVHPRTDSLCGSSRGSLGSSGHSLRLCADQGQSGENCYCPTLPRTRCQRAIKWIVGGFVVVACVTAALAALVVYRENIFSS